MKTFKDWIGEKLADSMAFKMEGPTLANAYEAGAAEQHAEDMKFAGWLCTIDENAYEQSHHYSYATIEEAFQHWLANVAGKG